MTDVEAAPRLPEDMLRDWPGRFRHAELMLRLHGSRSGEDVADALLAGLSAGQDENRVLQELMDVGEFDLGEPMLAEASEVNQRLRVRLSGELESRRAERATELIGTVRTLMEQAAAAGIPFNVDVNDLEARARESWPAVDEILRGRQRELLEGIEERRAELNARLKEAPPAPWLRTAVESLLAAGRLTVADRALQEGASDLSIPEIQPPLRSWRWQEPAAEVLSWHIDPTRACPPEFSAWRAVDDVSKQLLRATDGLGGGGQEAAGSFAAALEAFLGGRSRPSVVHAIDGGHLTTITLFQDEPLRPFHAKPGVDLFIADPDTRVAPDLPGVGHFLAVGTNVKPSSGFRRTGAVIGIDDILRLITVPVGRNLSLARIAGAQWPLAALGAGTPGALDELLGQDPAERWRTLCWLADLARLGGSATADSLLSQAGHDPETLHVLLAFLADATGPTPHRQLNNWADLERISVGVEAAVLRGCRGPASRAAFWAAMASAPPGTPLSLDALVLATSLIEAEADWEQAIASGFDELRHQWFVDANDAEVITLQPLGVLIGLRRLTERRLVELTRELDDTPDDVVAGLERDAWSAYRYALSPRWPEYLRLLADDSAVGASAMVLAAPAEDLIEEAASLSGSTGLAETVAELTAVALARYPEAAFDIDIQDGVRVAADRLVVLTVLYELLENALEATDRAGRIALSARASADDVLVDVRDSGRGLADEIVLGAQVFRPGFSTRGDGRGAGLHVARRIATTADGDIELVSAAGGHPVFMGAHFCLVLPRDRPTLRPE